MCEGVGEDSRHEIGHDGISCITCDIHETFYLNVGVFDHCMCT